MKKTLTFLIMLMFLYSAILIPIVSANNTNSYSNKKISLFSKDEKGPFLDRIISFFKKIPFINNTINFFKSIFGLVDQDNYVEVEEFDEEYGPYYQDMAKEPGSEKPTDTSISVKIKNYDLIYSEQGKNIEFDMTFEGSTTGNVYGCYYIIVSYFEDGTTAFANLWASPMKGSKVDMAGYSIDLSFHGTGPLGDTDWSSFKARQYISGVFDLDKKIFSIPQEEQDETLKDMRLYVRAFSDKELTKWNQDSISLFDEMSGVVYEPASGDGEEEQKDSGLPGFEVLILLMAIGLTLMILKKRTKNKF